MVLSHDELDRLSEQYGDRVIKRSTYCARCGYNLRSLPFRYNCPECGNRYYAHAIRRKGIFLEGETYFPVLDCIISVLSVIFGLGLILINTGRWSLFGLRIQYFFIGLVIASLLMSIVYALRAWPLFLDYRANYRVSKRVAQQRREEAQDD